MLNTMGMSVNEAITQLLTEQILGLDTNLSKGYELEKDVTRLLFGIIGKEKMLKFYFSEAKNFDEIYQELNSMFGDNSRSEISIISKAPSVIDILKLTDQLCIMKVNADGELGEDQLEAYNKIRGMICKNINDILSVNFNYKDEEYSLERKMQIIEALMQFHGISTNLYSKESLQILATIVNENKSLDSLGKKFGLYRKFAMGGLKSFEHRDDYYDSEMAKYMEDYCIAHGIIERSDFSKSGMLYRIFYTLGKEMENLSDADVKALLSNFSYIKFGNLYELSYHGIDSASMGPATHRVLFQENGNRTNIAQMYQFDVSGNMLQMSSEPFSSEYIKDEEYEENLKNQIRQIMQSSDKRFKQVRILGKDVMMYYYDGDGIEFNAERDVYSIDDDGNFVPAKEEGPRRLIDDVAERIDKGTVDSIVNSLIGLSSQRKKLILSNYFYYENVNLSIEDMINLYNKLPYNDSQLRKVVLDELEESYIAKGDFSKRPMLQASMLLASSKYDKADINKFYYRQVGNHYELDYDGELTENGNRYLASILYGSDGKEVHSDNAIRVSKNNTSGEVSYSPNSKVDENLFEKIKKVNESLDTFYSDINLLGKEIIFSNYSDDGRRTSVSYTLNENGEFELSPTTVPRRLTDDMSELDIQLMEETKDAGITITDLLNMTKQMESKEVIVDLEKID